jgi:hypothetical protein
MTAPTVFDIETVDWTSFFFGGVQDKDGARIYDWTQEDEYVDDLLSIEGEIYGHNSGKFDALWLLRHLFRREIDFVPTISGSSMIALQVKDGPCFVDTFRLAPMSLEKFAIAFGDKRKQPSPIPYEAYSFHGTEHHAEIKEYLRADLEALSSAHGALQDYAAAKGWELKRTIGSSAWATAQKRLELPDAEWNRRQYEWARSGYYGGRVSVGRTRAARIKCADINSAYPAALSRVRVPIGVPAWHDDASKAYAQGKEGIYGATVEVPEMFCPPLPVRSSDGARLGYPTGTIRGRWTGIELRHAEECGCRVRIHRGLVWPQAMVLFDTFIDDVWNARAEVIAREPEGKDHPRAQWIKLFANSLTGKFAQDPEGESFACGDHEEKTWCRAKNPVKHSSKIPCPRDRCCEHLCANVCGKWSVYGHPDLRLYSYPYWRIGDSAHVHYAAYLTAATRIQLHREMREDFVYCDTDSVKHLDHMPSDVGPELGQWEDEGDGGDWHCLAPKTYKYFSEKKSKNIIKAKGIPAAKDHWEKLVAGEGVPIGGVHSIRSALKGGSKEPFQKRVLTREIKPSTNRIGDRILLEGGETRAPTIDEFEKGE